MTDHHCYDKGYRDALWRAYHFCKAIRNTCTGGKKVQKSLDTVMAELLRGAQSSGVHIPEN